MIFAVLVEIFAIINLIFCLKGKQMKIVAVLLAILVTVFIGWLAVSCFLIRKLGKQRESPQTGAGILIFLLSFKISFYMFDASLLSLSL